MKIDANLFQYMLSLFNTPRDTLIGIHGDQENPNFILRINLICLSWLSIKTVVSNVHWIDCHCDHTWFHFLKFSWMTATSRRGSRGGVHRAGGDNRGIEGGMGTEMDNQGEREERK